MPTWATSAGKAITFGWLGPRAARVHAELLRSGCAGACRRVEGERAVLPAHPGVGADSDGAAGDGGDGHRVAGGDHRGILGGVAGGSTRLPAAAADRTHLGVDDRPDLRAVDQRVADGGGADPRLRVPQLGRAGVRVRHGGDGNDHDHHHAVLLLRPHPVGMAAVGGADRRRLAPAGGPDVPRGEPDQARAWRVAAAAHRHHRVHGDDDLAEGPRNRHAGKGKGRGSAARVRRRPAGLQAAADAHAGHGGVPQSRQGDGTAGDAGQRRAQPCAASST